MKLKYISTILIMIIGYVMYLNTSSRAEILEEDSIKENPIKEYNYVIGTQTVGSKYKFTEEAMIVETAKQIKYMGSNLLKFAMHPSYCEGNYGLPKNKKITSLVKLAIIEPSIKEVLDMDFKYYHIWVYGFSQYTFEPKDEKKHKIKFIDGYEDKYANALYEEIYDLTSHFLKTYNNTGKVFYLGNWEGDWHLRSDYDRAKPANLKTLEGMIRWAKIRQKAIDDAKKNVPHENIEVYHYIEVNLVQKAIHEKNVKVVTNSLIPEVNPDYVSYSSYDSTNPFKTEQETRRNLQQALDFIESQLQPKEGLPKGKRVWIGEYGNPTKYYSPEMQNERSKWAIKASLEWGTPFILYWEMYNNEIEKETGKQIGYWLIDDKEEKQPIWYTHHNFYIESAQFLKEYYEKYNYLPPFEDFQRAALNFDALKSN